MELTNNNRLPSDVTPLVKQAVLDAFTGADGGSRARIASDIYASRFYSAVASVHSAVAIEAIYIGTTTADQLKISVGVDQYPTLDVSAITVELV